MWKEIKLDGKGWARGRNGYFVPRKLEVFKDVRGQINLLVFSRQVGKTEPLSFRVSGQEAALLGRHLLAMGATRKASRAEGRSHEHDR
jgi:hypothetical protein